MTASGGAIVDRFTTLEQLSAVEGRWRELFAADPSANFFLSWEWMQACLATLRTPWFVLGVRYGNGEHVAFLALDYEHFPAFGPPVNRELRLAGMPRADYTGMLALPGEEGRVIPALARYVGDLPWDNFTLNDCGDARVAALVRALDPERYALAEGEPTGCPYLELPPSFDAYVAGLSDATRRTVRTKMRKIEALPGFAFRWVPPEEADDAIDLLIRINSVRWQKELRKRRRIFADLFRRCYASGRFVVATLHDGETLLAAQGSFIEPASKTLLGYMMGYNAEYSRLSPGTMLLGFSLREAIARGFARYEFGRGAGGFKQSFCSGVHYTSHLKVTRRGLRVAAINAGRSGFFAAKGVARTLLRRSA